jgi:hypothetical protein
VKHKWFLSEVRVRQMYVDAEATFTDPLAEAVEKAKKTTPDKGKYSIMVALEEIEGELRGVAKCGNNEVTITYSDITGLSIIR